jgi:hypothetical protein
MRRIGFCVTVIGVCVLVAAGGCAGKKASLSLKFTPNETSTYKVVTETVKDYKFEQPSVNQTKTQQTLSKAEVVFDQTIQSVEPGGDAKALITIKEVKYLVKNPQGTTLDFDSAREADKKNPLEGLVGLSYVIKITPAGEVVAVEDAQKAREAVKGDSMELKTAQALLSDDSIKQRHTLVALPSAKEASAKTWSKVKGGPAGMLAPRSYEKVYTLKEVKNEGGKQVAVVEMNARPSSVKAADMPKDEAKGMGFFEKMFDNKETYAGEMLLDLSTGKVNSYSEKLKSDWVAVEPADEVKSDKGPDVLTMGFSYSYSIEKVK